MKIILNYSYLCHSKSAFLTSVQHEIRYLEKYFNVFFPHTTEVLQNHFVVTNILQSMRLSELITKFFLDDLKCYVSIGLRLSFCVNDTQRVSCGLSVGHKNQYSDCKSRYM